LCSSSKINRKKKSLGLDDRNITYFDTRTENSFEPGATGCEDIDAEAEVAIGGVDTVDKVGRNIVVVGCDVTIGIRGVDVGVIRRGEIFVFVDNIVCGEVANL
jgi:hypothetical protein